VYSRSGSEDEDTFLSERGQSLPHVVMVSAISIGLNGELAHRDVSLGIHEHQWNPSTVVEPSLLILINMLNARCQKQFLHPLRQFWSSRWCILDLRKAK
jgi:hypothetical protein